MDLDGTIFRGEQLLPGAREAVARLGQQGHPILFATNALGTSANVAAFLTRLGLPTSSEQVVTPLIVLKRYLAEHVPHATVYVIGEPPLLQELAADFRLSEDPAEIDAVIASTDPTFDFHKLTIAFHALRHGARFLATNTDPTWPIGGKVIPDAGAIIGALEGCTQRKVEAVMGKPSVHIAKTALELLGRGSEETWMVGDSLVTDIAMGQQAGMRTVVVLTGVTSRADLATSTIQPDHVIERISDLPALLEGR
jgi:arabinose operon protein AraL